MASDDKAGNPAKIQVLKDALYDEIRQHGSETRLFTQKDLLDLDIIPSNNITLLIQVVQGLCDDKLLVAASNQHVGLAWRWRSREEAKKYTSLPDDETIMVYSIIDEAGADGIWNRTIKNRLNMHENVVKNCIKFLETKGYIASMKNVEHPNKKMYIKATLKPSERATGGPWFTDGELDTAFVEELQAVVFEYIKTHSAYLSSQSQPGNRTRVPKKGTIRGGGGSEGSGSDPRGIKRSAIDISNDDDAMPAPTTTTSRPKPSHTIYLPLPPGYKKYPTVPEITEFIQKSGITNNTTLTEPDIQQLVDVLMYDGLIEPIRVNKRQGYRVTRPMKQDTVPFHLRQKEREAGIGLDKPLRLGPEPPSSALTEMPCGRCPVFDLCGEGGPVSPKTCVYMLEWLGLEAQLKPLVPNTALPP
ncbi:34-kDa subunit of RNA polymerase III (C) [Madurella fahalii]|uniref:34-kDa subunit of RNA polymerase III (C) n=1 Tax=Madurella fahalii TaxID=1157608 RepID=A0ABQ0FYM5_9PEZI